ncbi:MAG: class I SAM-dependent methyltransferase [Desulfuromonadales bacterium]|nr:class I SAM-dependent methyltransferase [Desulfuromonadales bacterium]
MMAIKTKIDSSYTQFYADRKHRKVYPTEFVVRTFLSSYPNLNFRKPQPDDSVLDVAFGDGRNTVFLGDLGLQVAGIEITEDIVTQTGKRLAEMGYHPDLRVGRNSRIPFAAETFDYILACHCCYYCDEGETLIDNLREYHRVLKPGGAVVASVADRKSYIFQGAQPLTDGTMRISNDPYRNREGYRLHGFSTEEEIEHYCSDLFKNFSFGHADNDYYGIREQVFWMVCEKK